MSLQLTLGLVSYGLILLFGVGLTAAFSLGPQEARRNLRPLIIFSTFAIAVQIVSWRLVGLERTRQLYPLIVHLPLVLFMVARFKRRWIQAVTGVFSAYLCLQIPRWIAMVVQAVVQTRSAYYIAYYPAIFLAYYVLWRYVADPVWHLTDQSTRSCLFLGSVPFFYYLFDYSATVYTGWLYTGALVAVQFIPSVVAMFYFVFAVIYYEETRKQADAEQKREQMEAQFKQARTELAALRQTQEQTRRYRHDMRHHFTFLQTLAAEGDVARITEYLHTAQSDLDAFTPVRYCENETANLLLSSFEVKAKQAGVALNVVVKLPEELPLSETELCSLFSNSLENAITAAAQIPDSGKKAVALRSAVYQGKLLLSVENPYVGQVRIKMDGLPQAVLDDLVIQDIHGYGTRSIAAIAESHGGQAVFSVKDGVFSLKVMLPMHGNRAGCERV